jgi:hypothetical protein
MTTTPDRMTRAGPEARRSPVPAYGAAAWALVFAVPHLYWGIGATTGLTGITIVAAGDQAEFLRLARWFLFLWLPWFTLGAVTWGALATHHTGRGQP